MSEHIRFDWSGPFNLSDQLSEDELMISETAASYARDNLQPRVIIGRGITGLAAF